MARTPGMMGWFNTAVMNGVGVHLNADEFDTQIELHGSTGTHCAGITCPCMRNHERTPDAMCAHCRGQGYLYPEQTRTRTIALDTSRSATAKLVAAGKMLDGSVQLTFRAGIVPAWGDLWLPDGEEHVVEEVLVQRTDPVRTDAGIWRVTSDSRPVAGDMPKPRLLYPHFRSIDLVTWLERGIDGTTTVKYPPASEYSVDADGRWTWRPGAGPPPGQVWTVRYRAPAAYRVFQVAPRYRTEADQRMPHAVTARRLDRVGADDLAPVVRP